MGSSIQPQSAVFPVLDLEFAFAWSRHAPGIGGWELSVVEMNTGELIEIVPPGAEFPVFYVVPRENGVEIIRERVIEVGGGQVSVANAPSLREALLLLCRLPASDLDEIDDELRTISMSRISGRELPRADALPPP